MASMFSDQQQRRRNRPALFLRINSSSTEDRYDPCCTGIGFRPMMRGSLENANRIRLRPEAKARLVRAAELRHMRPSDFVIEAALREADAVVSPSARFDPSERDRLMVLELLENPPGPNKRLRSAIDTLPKP